MDRDDLHALRQRVQLVQETTQSSHRLQQDIQKIRDYIAHGSEGDLDLSYSYIIKLPERLRVGGKLNLSNAHIKSLPSELHVGSRLYLQNTPITSLPGDLRVEEGLYFNGPLTIERVAASGAVAKTYHQVEGYDYKDVTAEVQALRTNKQHV